MGSREFKVRADLLQDHGLAIRFKVSGRVIPALVLSSLVSVFNVHIQSKLL